MLEHTLKDDIAALQQSGQLDLEDNPNARAYLEGKFKIAAAPPPAEAQRFGPTRALAGEELKVYNMGKEIFNRDGYCGTCHQPNGLGMPNVYPPLLAKGNPWLTDHDERLIKIVLKGLWGPLELNGQRFDPAKGLPPMPGFGGMLNNEEIAAVLSYVRQSFGNDLPLISGDQVAAVRARTKAQLDFYMVEDLMKEHPIPGWEKWGHMTRPAQSEFE